MIDSIDEIESETSKESKEIKVQHDLLDVLSDIAETTIEMIANIIKD